MNLLKLVLVLILTPLATFTATVTATEPQVDVPALHSFVQAHATRGQCQCGQCLAREGTAQTPSGHIVSTTFFDVGLHGRPDVDTFKRLVAPLLPLLTQERSYLELGGLLGSQDLALNTMALGHLLGVWDLLTPDSVMPFLPKDVRMAFAQRGLVTIKSGPGAR